MQYANRNYETDYSFTDNQLYPRAIADPVLPPSGGLSGSAGGGNSNGGGPPGLNLPPPSPPVLEPRCCGGRLPASVVNKLNKLSARGGFIKMVGQFGLKENLYYGSIFICMTLIVIVCFLVINNGGGSSLMGGSTAAFDGGNTNFLKEILQFVVQGMS